jgi:hypothetical protein
MCVLSLVGMANHDHLPTHVGSYLNFCMQFFQWFSKVVTIPPIFKYVPSTFSLDELNEWRDDELKPQNAFLYASQKLNTLHSAFVSVQ